MFVFYSPHCLQAKSTLQDLKLPFVDVSVDRFPPYVREWVKEKTGKTSVPQIFFNKEYIGGNKEFQETIKDDTKFQALLDEVQKNEVLDDKDPLLPNPADAINAPKSLTTDFHCELDEYAAFVNELKESGIVKDRKPGGLRGLCATKMKVKTVKLRYYLVTYFDLLRTPRELEFRIKGGGAMRTFLA